MLFIIAQGQGPWAERAALLLYEASGDMLGAGSIRSQMSFSNFYSENYRDFSGAEHSARCSLSARRTGRRRPAENAAAA